MSINRNLAIRFLLIGSGILLALLLLEISTRWLIPPLPNSSGHIHETAGDETLPYELIPGAEGIVAGVRVRINSYGLRDREFPVEKPSNMYRIVVLGDSWTFGSGVELKDTYGKQLEHLLNSSSLTNMQYQVINAGVGGYNTVNEVRFFEKKLMGLRPDLVIVGYNIHNVEIGRMYVNEGSGTKRVIYEGPQTALLPYGLMNKIRRSSTLLQIMFNNSETILYALRVRRYDSLYSVTNEGWQAVQSSFDRLSALARSGSAKAMVVMFPILSNLNKSYPFLPIHDIVKQAAEQSDMLFCDLYPTFKGHSARSLWLHPLDRHPNVVGHRLISEGIYKFLIELQLVGRRKV